jgi:hypothetical protein
MGLERLAGLLAARDGPVAMISKFDLPGYMVLFSAYSSSLLSALALSNAVTVSLASRNKLRLSAGRRGLSKTFHESCLPLATYPWQTTNASESLVCIWLSGVYSSRSFLLALVLMLPHLFAK